jgi:hypothetical protein
MPHSDPNPAEQSNDAAPHASRRAFVAKAAYLAPVLLTFPTRLSAAQVGSGGGDCMARDPITGEIVWYPAPCDS